MRGESKATKERRELGRASLLEASRILGRHRETVLRMVADGQLERHEDGTFDAEECRQVAEELEANRTDPAVEHLKHGFKWALKSQDDNLRTYLNAHAQILETQARVITQQSQHVESLIKEVQSLSAKLRAYEDGSAEREALQKAAEGQSKTQDEFLSLLKDTVGGYMREKSIAGKLAPVMESLSEEQAEKLGEILTPSQLQQFSGALQSIQTLTEGKSRGEA
jgi:alkanesulfonate monooxygenase SsuD/methylene tetrahydromethanopterin reductase-like flavin-dependent oxidoreductase (luciferase family)